MGKWLASLLLLFMLFSILSGFLAGGDGLAITTLTQPLLVSDNHMHVTSTSGYLTAGTVIVDSETITYTGATTTTFTGLTRGTSGTTAAEHVSASYVLTRDANTLSNAMGFDIASTAQKASVFSVIVIPLCVLTITMPQLMMWNFQFMQGDLVWIALPFFAISAALIVVIALSMIHVAQGMFSGS